MRRLNPEYVKTIIDKVNGCPYFSLLSMEIGELKPGSCRMAVDVQEKHLQPFGNVHGGVFSSLADATAFWAVYPQIDEGVGMTTVELKLNYLEPSNSGSLIGKGRSLRVGKTLCLGEAQIEDEQGRLLAHGTSTMMLLRDLRLTDEHKLPKKFLDE
jgi:uncharacterized protein (TIGR00369 family)